MAFGIASGPHAFKGLIFFSSFVAPAVLMSMSSRGWYSGVFIVGSGGPSSGVKTDWNCFNRILALDLESLYNVDLSFNGATPLLSCLRLLTHYQKGLVFLFLKPSEMISFI